MLATVTPSLSFPVMHGQRSDQIMSILVDILVNGFMAYGLTLMINRQPSGYLFRTPMNKKSVFNVPSNFIILQAVALMRQALSLNGPFVGLVAEIASFSYRRSIAVKLPGYRRVIPTQLTGDAPETLTFCFQDADLVSLLYCQMRII